MTKGAIRGGELRGIASTGPAGGGGGVVGQRLGNVTKLIGKIRKMGGAFASLGPASLPALAAVAAAVLAIAGYVSSIIPELAAAGLGVGAFGALAMPIFSQITKAVTGLGKAQTAVARDKVWDAVPKALQPAVRTILDIKAAWTAMSKSMTPLVGQIATTAGSIVNKLPPVLKPLAVSAGNAIEGLLKQFDKVAGSPGFKAFFANTARMAWPAITAIRQGI